MFFNITYMTQNVLITQNLSSRNRIIWEKWSFSIIIQKKKVCQQKKVKNKKIIIISKEDCVIELQKQQKKSKFGKATGSKTELQLNGENSKVDIGKRTAAKWAYNEWRIELRMN